MRQRIFKNMAASNSDNGFNFFPQKRTENIHENEEIILNVRPWANLTEND